MTVVNSSLRSYNLAWRLARPVLRLILGLRARRGKEDSTRLGERFGRYPGNRAIPQGAIWLHAVSVGETVAALALIEALASRMPGQPFLVTTNTTTAADLVARAWQNGKSPAAIWHLYQPLDHPAFVDRFLKTTKPKVAVFLESDFWPNLVTRAADAHIPVVFASSQISERAMRGWQRRPAIARTLFSCADLVLPVNAGQAANFRNLGVLPDRIQVIGSLKMAPSALAVDAELVADIKRASADRQIFLAASTHPGEDEIIIAAGQALGDNWMTIIAPRHPERGPEVARLCQQTGSPAERRATGALAGAGQNFFIMDTLGDMGSLFTVADSIFLGGSLQPLGGHNPLEPASFGKPVITGPHVFKNSAEFDGLRAIDAVQDVTGVSDLVDAIRGSVSGKAATAKHARTIKKYVAQAGNRRQIAADYIHNLANQEPHKG